MQLSNKITNNGCHHLKGDAPYSNKSVSSFQRILLPQLATMTKFQYLSTRLYVTSQKAEGFIATPVRISNETNTIKIVISVCLSLCQSNQSLFIHTRQRNNFYLPQANLTIYQKGAYYSGIKIFNNLPLEIKNVAGNKKN